MPYKFSDFKVNCIAELLEQGIEPVQVASAMKCGLTKMYKVRRNLKHFNTPTTPKLSVQDRSRKLTRKVLDVSIVFIILAVVETY